MVVNDPNPPHSAAPISALPALADSADLIARAATYASAFHQADIGLAVADADDGALEDVNPVFAAMLGYDPGALCGCRLDDITHP
ncbi:MAG: PAS domain-containing protein, partial [Thermomicrobiales bacterium]|nr:PAS domain-containing protein [Thermomicrobiales bacterium]